MNSYIFFSLHVCHLVYYWHEHSSIYYVVPVYPAFLLVFLLTQLYKTSKIMWDWPSVCVCWPTNFGGKFFNRNYSTAQLYNLFFHACFVCQIPNFIVEIFFST